MPWDRWSQRGGLGELLEQARESRGLSLSQAVEKIAVPELYVVRQQIADQYNPPLVRRLAQTLTDEQIFERAATITIARLYNWEQNIPDCVIRIFDLAILADAYHYPIGFFREHNRKPPGPDLIVHIKMSGPKEPVCAVCGFLAWYFCDYAIRNGNTCSKPLCAQHAIIQGHALEDRHYCPAHDEFTRAGLAVSPEPEGPC